MIDITHPVISKALFRSDPGLLSAINELGDALNGKMPSKWAIEDRRVADSVRPASFPSEQPELILGPQIIETPFGPVWR